MEQLLANFSGSVRRDTLNGREHIVAPLSLIVPGVLNGSKGSLYYPPEEISRNVDAWNGMPIVVNHPVIAGKHVSARSPAIINRQGIGNVYSAVANGRLTAEGWFDIERTNKVDSRIIRNLEAGKRIELSTGLFTENERVRNKAANYNGKPYTHIARNYRPDHLAILPDMVGACSLNDGCGVNVNESSASGEQTAPAKECTCATGETCDNCLKANELQDTWDKLGELLGITDNIGKFGNPQSLESGKFKKLGAGTGKGEQHSAAQSGGMHLSDEDKRLGSDAQAQARAGQNPASWVADEATWERAKTAADKGDYDDATYWAVVTHIYKNMGGTTNNTKDDGQSGASVTNERKAAMATKLTEKERETIVNNLCTNCDCWKGEGDRETLNSFDDDKLVKLNTNYARSKQAEAVVNAAKEGFGAQFKQDTGKELTVNEMPAFMKKKMAKMEDPKEEEDEEEEEEVVPPKKKTPPAVNAAPTTANRANRLTADEMEAIEFANNERQRQKDEIIEVMVANVAEEQQEAVTKVLNSKSLAELQTLRALTPAPVQQRGQENVPHYSGAAAPVGNRGRAGTKSKVDDDDILPLPTYNWEKEEKTA